MNHPTLSLEVQGDIEEQQSKKYKSLARLVAVERKTDVISALYLCQARGETFNLSVV